MSITIGPVRIADADGTHEPGEMIDNPSEALIELAEAATVDPQTRLPYATRDRPGARDTTPTAPAPEPEPEPVASATSAEEAA